MIVDERMSSQKSRDLDDLTRCVLFEEIPNQDLMRLTSFVIGMAFILFVSWAAVTNVNEVARTKGAIIPSGYAQIVQHLEGGIVNEILVEEGDLVEKGQILVHMGGIGAAEDFAGLGAQQTGLLLQAERLRASAHGKTPDFSQFVKDDPAAVSNQQRILEASHKAHEGEQKVLQDQLAQKGKALERWHSKKVSLGEEIEVARELLGMNERLVKRGSASRKDYLDAKREVGNLNGENNETVAEIAQAEQAIREYQNRLKTLDAKYRDEGMQALENVETEIARNRETLNKLQSRVERMEVRAPVRGLVKGLHINTIGGVVGPGEPIMEIVPLDRHLVVEARISPKDIGHLKVGQPARVKVSAFDFSRHGAIEGDLEFISATTFIDEEKNSFYKGRIALTQGYVGQDPARNLILPGMTVEADIITGEKTVLAYLLKPIHTSLNSAFRER